MMILDGFGMNHNKRGNAIALAKTPHFDTIFRTYPLTELAASGPAVGLPQGQMGNSEVGHLTIGSGRIIYQDLLRISHDIQDGTFFANKELLRIMQEVKRRGSSLHLAGLLSDGGVHSHISHLFALLEMAKREGLARVYIHCFLDGRDTPPKAAASYLQDLLQFMAAHHIGTIATLAGRYYAMDRDKRWDRIQRAYDAMVTRTGQVATDPLAALRAAYAAGQTDEFIQPICIEPASAAESAAVKDGDGFILYNFRPDRSRQIMAALVDPAFDGFPREKTLHRLLFCGMTEYDASIHARADVAVCYPQEPISRVLGEHLASLGLSQLRIAETEKYAHVTYFFDGGVERDYSLETKILVPSPKVATYDLQPEMSARVITEKVLQAVDQGRFDCIIMNFANADMVGHTGVLKAAIQAVEALDECVGRIADAVLRRGGEILLTADHGNADVMIDEEGQPMTAHSLNPVPFCCLSPRVKSLRDGGGLCDVAPTLLAMMGLPLPKEMTGHSLVSFD